MENRDLGWIDLGLGSPKTLFSAKKPWFLGYFWPFPIIWGFPLGPLLVPIGPIGAGGSGEAFGSVPVIVMPVGKIRCDLGRGCRAC